MLYVSLIPHLTSRLLNWKRQRDSYSWCSSLQTLWFSFQVGCLAPLKIILSPAFLDFLLACVLYSGSSSGHSATLEKPPVLSSQSLSPSISAQPHPHSSPTSVDSTFCCDPSGHLSHSWREVKSPEPTLIYCPSFLLYGDLKESGEKVPWNRDV